MMIARLAEKAVYFGLRAGAGLNGFTMLLKHSAILILFMCMSATVQGTDTQLTLLTEENPPYNFMDAETGAIKGSAVLIVTEIMTRASIDYSLHLLPWKRAYQRARAHPNTCVFATNRTSEREALFTWVGPLVVGGWAIFKRPDSPINISRLEDLRPYIVAGKKDGGAIEPIEKTAQIRVLVTSNDEAAAKLLYHGRADLWISGISDAPLAAATIGQPAPKIAFVWKEASLSLACNKRTPQDLIRKLNEMNARLDDFRKTAVASFHNRE